MAWPAGVLPGLALPDLCFLTTSIHSCCMRCDVGKHQGVCSSFRVHPCLHTACCTGLHGGGGQGWQARHAATLPTCYRAGTHTGAGSTGVLMCLSQTALQDAAFVTIKAADWAEAIQLREGRGSQWSEPLARARWQQECTSAICDTLCQPCHLSCNMHQTCVCPAISSAPGVGIPCGACTEWCWPALPQCSLQWWGARRQGAWQELSHTEGGACTYPGAAVHKAACLRHYDAFLQVCFRCSCTAYTAVRISP